MKADEADNLPGSFVAPALLVRAFASTTSGEAALG